MWSSDTNARTYYVIRPLQNFSGQNDSDNAGGSKVHSRDFVRVVFYWASIASRAEPDTNALRLISRKGISPRFAAHVVIDAFY